MSILYVWHCAWVYQRFVETRTANNKFWQLSWKYINVGSESMQQHFLFFFCFCSIHPSSSTSLCGAYVTHHAPWPLTVQSLASQAICPVFRSSPGATNPTSIYPLSKPSISSWEIGKDSLRCHQSVTEVTNTDTQTHSHPQQFVCLHFTYSVCLWSVAGNPRTRTENMKPAGCEVTELTTEQPRHADI